MKMRKFTAWLDKNYYSLLICGTVLFLLWAIAITQIKIIFLNSDSIPYKICLQVYNLKPKKDSLCAFNFKGRTFVKYLVGTAGDEVKYVGKVIYVGLTRVGEAKTTDLLSPTSEGKIPEGYVFVAGTHEDSFDSRYKEFGLIASDAITGVVPLMRHSGKNREVLAGQALD